MTTITSDGKRRHGLRRSSFVKEIPIDPGLENSQIVPIDADSGAATKFENRSACSALDMAFVMSRAEVALFLKGE